MSRDLILTRENLLTRAEEFDQGDWLDSNSTVIANDTIAPDGTLTEDRITGDGSSTFDSQRQTISVSWLAGQKITVRLFVKENTVVPDFVNWVQNVTAGKSAYVRYSWVAGKPVFLEKIETAGVINDHAIIPYPNNWFSIWLTITIEDACSSFIFAPHIAYTNTTSNSSYLLYYRQD